MKKEIERVAEIARDVRTLCERFARSSKSVQYDYHNCRDLTAMCATASAALLDALLRHGISSWFVIGEFDKDNHCWVEYNDLILDITATQFGVDQKVFITGKSDESYSVKHRYYNTYPSTVFGMEEQDPSTEVVEMILDGRVR